MKRASKIFSVFAILASLVTSQAGATASEKRLALVVGNASYKAQPLATAVNDAALVSQTLQLAGFDVTGVRDLDQNLLREAFRSFTRKVANAGAGAVVFVYFSGYAVQLAGENYLVPVGTEISDVADIPARTLSLSELMQAFSAPKPKATFIVLDAGRPGPFVLAGQAGGLVWTEPATNMLVAFSTAPGTSARDRGGSFGPYARALAEMIGEADLTSASLFDRVRLRVHELTAGGQVPWDASRIETPFRFLERTLGTAPDDAAARLTQLRLQSMRVLGAQNAYMIALLRDTFDAYADFLADYWQDPTTKRVRALLAARRESITWKLTCQANEAIAYWSYLERYPNGPHAAEASRQLARMGVSATLPSKFVRMDYEVPPPLPDELEYIAQPALILDDPSFGFENPPPIPADVLGSPPRELANLKPPAASQGHTLPVLNLSVLASGPAPRDGRAPPNSSSNGDEAWVMKPAVDVPSGPQKQVVTSFASPLLPPKSVTNRANEQPPANANSTQTKTPGAQRGNQVQTKADSDRSVQDDGTSALQSTSQAAPAMPAWLTDVVSARNLRVSPGPSIIGSGMSQSAPSMFASASAGLTFQTWNYRRHRSRPVVRNSVSIAARPASLPPPPVGLPGSPTSPSHATGSILPSSPRSAAVPAPAANGSSSRPSANQLQPPWTAAALAKPRKRHSTIKPVPPSEVAPEQHEPRVATPSDQ
jgi:uncharacterized caspase-like protein